jgi:nicotinamidase-related amidase
VAPLPAGAALPNALHVGRAESARLLGDPAGAWASEGPLARFAAAFRDGQGPDHAAILIRDWHDPADPATRAHLDHFGDHCLRGSPGARFVEALQPLLPRARVVDSAILSDFVGTGLEPLLRELLGPEPEVRAGLIGVWTDVKVRYLAYDLMTRLGLQQIAVCSALCASRSRLQHREALQHLEDALGVEVIDSIPGFLEWLGARGAPRPLAARGRPAPRISGVSLGDEERRLVEHLFRDCREVHLAPLSGGFSGSRVFRSASTDVRGLGEVPFVVKIDSHARIARERVAVESVENLLGAASPRLADYVDLETLGAIKYQFATMHGGEVRTLRQAYRAAATPAEVEALFEAVIKRVLARLYQRPVLDRMALAESYGCRRFAGETLESIGALCAGEDGSTLVLPFTGDRLPHPRRFYHGLEGQEEPLEVACAWVHGDLNLANVLLDEAGNVWLIDYFWTAVDHALKDVAKLENDLKFLMVPLPDDAALSRAIAWERRLLAQDDLLAPPPALPAELLGDPGIARAHAAISRLRRLGAALLSEAGLRGVVGPRQYHLAQIRYSAHSLTFAECDPRQRAFALASTCLLAERLAAP